MDKSFDPAGETRKSRTLSRLGDDDAETGGGLDQRELALLKSKPFLSSLPSLSFSVSSPASCEQWIAPAEGARPLQNESSGLGTANCQSNRRRISTAGGEED